MTQKTIYLAMCIISMSICSIAGVSISRDALGRHKRIVDSAGETIFEYNSHGALTTETTITSYGTNTLTRHYDRFGRLVGYSLNGERMTTLEYCRATGRISSMSLSDSTNRFEWAYRPGSDLKASLHYPNGLTASWQYNSRGLLIQVVNAFATNTVSQYNYSYNAAREIISVESSGSAVRFPNIKNYTYNIRGEMASCETGSMPGANRYFEYDDAGNRSVFTTDSKVNNYIANKNNQYTMSTQVDPHGLAPSQTFHPQYDADGNQTLVKTSTGEWSVLYDAENRPVSWTCGPTNVIMTYDYRGRRVRYIEECGGVTNSDFGFVYDGSKCIARIDLTESSNRATEYYIWDPTEPVATKPLARIGGDDTSYYTYDGCKNVSELLSSSQTILAHYEYLPFGMICPTEQSFAPANPFGFSAEYADRSLGLVYYNYRHYNPLEGRWTKRDALDCQNPYAFCCNSPVGIIDIQGDVAVALAMLHPGEQPDTAKYVLSASNEKVNDMIERLKAIPESEYVKAQAAGNVKFNKKPFLGTKAQYIKMLERESGNIYFHSATMGLSELKSKLAVYARLAKYEHDQIAVVLHGVKDAGSGKPTGRVYIGGREFDAGQVVSELKETASGAAMRGQLYIIYCYRTWDGKSNPEDYTEYIFPWAAYPYVRKRNPRTPLQAIDFRPAGVSRVRSGDNKKLKAEELNR